MCRQIIKYSFLLVFCLIPSTIAQNWFPLEVGNRWDYNVDVEIPGGSFNDTLSVEIVDTIVLSNSLKYFEFSIPFPLWYSVPYARFVREENNKIYFLMRKTLQIVLLLDLIYLKIHLI